MSTRQRLLHVSAAQLCKLAYTKEVAKENLGPDVENLREITADDIRVLLIETSERTTLVFRGTVFESKSSVIRNTKYDLAQDEKHRVHSGYLEGLNWVYDEIMDQIWDRPKRVPLSLIGHSAGGALASVFAARVFARRMRNKNYPQIDQLLTFGAPRVGDAEYVKTIRKLLTTPANVVRYTSVNDPIPRLPPIWRGLRHGLKEHYLSSSGEIVFDPWWVRRVLDGLYARVTNSGLFALAESHGIDAYIQLLARAGR